MYVHDTEFSNLDLLPTYTVHVLANVAALAVCEESRLKYGESGQFCQLQLQIVLQQHVQAGRPVLSACTLSVEC